ncbi:STN domain-containing protein [Achromobacter insuavis]
MNDALSAFARQAGISLAYSSAQLARARSAGLNGAFDTADGLRALLAGTGYRAVNVDGGIRIEAEPRTGVSTLSPVLVSGTYHAQTEGRSRTPPARRPSARPSRRSRTFRSRSRW